MSRDLHSDLELRLGIYELIVYHEDPKDERPNFKNDFPFL